MAMAIPPDTTPPTAPTTPDAQPEILPSRIPSNPTPLSAPQEQQVRDLYYKNVREKCAAEIQAFAACANGRTLTMIYSCRPEKLSMNSCLLSYQGPDQMDIARAEWFRLAGERKRAREEEKRKVEEGRRRHREWWGLDENGKLVGKKGGGGGGEKGGV